MSAAKIQLVEFYDKKMIQSSDLYRLLNMSGNKIDSNSNGGKILAVGYRKTIIDVDEGRTVSGIGYWYRITITMQ